VSANKRRAAALIGVFTLGVAIVLGLVSLVLVPPLIGMPVALAAAAVLAGVAFAKADDLVLTMVNAELAHPVKHARLHNLVESLCFSSGLPKPDVYVVEDDALNAFATGRGPRRAAVGVTTGLLAGFTPIELEAVLAHELSRVKSYDVLVSTLAVAIVGVLTSVLPRATSTRLMNTALGAPRDSTADLTGVALTRYPPGLISALEKLHVGSTEVRGGRRAAAHLWLEPLALGADVGEDERAGELLKARIEALREL
jgi:heat shock protein HtpX